ncbi:SphA family protein [Bradyrhizobium symbiodeficiens]|uniref:Transporter n=1 Tax=Bradyrhizobium symbiodeficiens TaxID=1404367 RepID=A0ABX5W5U6_9BRAD|nr:transporter [Bradyrhizobium symbiodeficiens]QDF37816.1 phenol degradation protein meta [Bradyrhizobium symbiodeficiens]QIP00310.1 phenol degradation protein meta [Bradyrhizobium symbiodeficiens]
MTSYIARGRRLSGALAAAALAVLSPQMALADESGISFWLPGLYGSLSATPSTPGWSIAAIYYHASVGASGGAAASREFQVGRFSPNVNIDLNLSVHGQADLMLIAPTYTFATPVLGGQLSATLASVYGRNSASLAGTLTTAAGPIVSTHNGFLEDALVSYGDLYPTFRLKWNNGVHNYMVYGAGDIPVGDYSALRLSNIGLGHGAIDFGGGYTYLNPTTGTELSGVGGFTYNFKNPDTQYQSGIDFHFDWGVSQFLSKQIFVGFVGYGYQQITDDSGQPAVLGGFRSRVFGVGPQIGYIFPIGSNHAFLGLKGYGEFAAANRPSGWNTWLTFSISEAVPTSTLTPTRHSASK